MSRKLYGRFLIGRAQELEDQVSPAAAVTTWVDIATRAVESEAANHGGVDWSTFNLRVGKGEPPFGDVDLVVTVDALSKGD